MTNTETRGTDGTDGAVIIGIGGCFSHPKNGHSFHRPLDHLTGVTTITATTWNMPADPSHPPDALENGNAHHDPDVLRIVNLLTSKVSAVLSDRMTDGRAGDQRKVVKLVTSLTAGLDSSLQNFVTLIHNVAREELTKELADLREETRTQTEEAQVTAETVKTCSSIVSRIKRLRDMRRNADLVSGTKLALEREEEAVRQATVELQILDKNKLRALLDDANAELRKYNDLIKQAE